MSDSIGKSLRDQYLAANHFPHIVLDNYFTSAPIADVEREVYQNTTWSGVSEHSNASTKLHLSEFEHIPRAARELVQYFNSPEFLIFLEDLTGIAGLISDPYLEGGGIHRIGRGGFLNMHADFNYHAKLKLHRRVNVLFYLNSEWRTEFCGDLLLGDPRCEDLTRIAPLANRLVVFNTTSTSLHGHPEPLRCPGDRYRCSLAFYYYSSDRPDFEKQDPHSTLYLEKDHALV